jgi:putative ABC transport system permease protein
VRKLLLGQLRYRTGRVLGLSVGILVVSVSFVLLTSAVASSELEVTGTVSRSFRPAYDILVRPGGSFTGIERTEGLVQANYLSGIFGGITFADYRAIKNVPGVEVAAPIANVGYVMPFEFNPVYINDYLDDSPAQLYRLSIEWVSNHGLSRYPESPQYVYYTRRDPLVIPSKGGRPQQRTNGGVQPVCSGFVSSAPALASSPFSLQAGSGLACFSELSPSISYSSTDFGDLGRGRVGAVFPTFFPVQIAAIDEVEEQKLLNLEDTITSGRMLNETDGVHLEKKSGDTKYQVVPILASDRTYVGDVADVTVERLATGSSGDLVRRLSSQSSAFEYVTNLGGRAVGHVRVPVQRIYERMLDSLSRDVKSLNITYDGYWTTGATTYSRRGEDHYVARQRPRQQLLYDFHLYGDGWAPQANLDTHFRKLAFYQASSGFSRKEVFGTPALKVVGTFDPTKLPGFSPLSSVPLETYYPPVVRPADRAATVALGGHRLLPTQNLGGYISQPPLLLTTLRGLEAFTDEDNFRPIDPHLAPLDHDAPLAAIRVRVAGVTGPDPLSRKRIETVARQIHDRTGLTVDVTAGSSPHPLEVELPAGRFGAPALTVEEGWVLKGVAVKFLRAVDHKSLALFFLVLFVCALFLANAAFAAARSRRTEIGTLLCLGWSRKTVFAVILSELGVVGLLAGVAGTLLSMPIVSILDFRLSTLNTVMVVPIALLLALASGLLPAWRASRGSPLDAVRPAIRAPETVARVRNVAGMAAANLSRVPSRTIVGATGLFVGVAALTILIAIQRGFQGALVGTLLGSVISIQVRGVDLLAASLVIALGALSVADVLFLNISERRVELVTLRTLGWRAADVARVVCLEGVGMGLLGAGAGALLGLFVSVRIIGGVAVSVGVTASALALAIGVAAASIAALVPALRIGSLTAPAVLAEE